MSTNKPCGECPWVTKGQPLITDELRKSNDSGSWFCCHKNCGTCHGAEKMRNKIKPKQS
jgi:hypothetical protein